MRKKQSFNSPLSRIEQEAARQKGGNAYKRFSMSSALSSDSGMSTGGLLDKLKLADNEWNDEYESFNGTSYENSSDILYGTDDHDSSIGSNITLNNSSSNNTTHNNTPEQQYATNYTTNAMPASKFKYLKSVLGDTQRNNSKRSAVNKALEMGKKINTVEKNASHVNHRASVHSIHVEDLLRDADSTLSSITSQSDNESDDDSELCFNPQIYNNNNNNNDEELSFLQNTPTRQFFDTPTNSPETVHATPQLSMNSTPQMHLLSHHNHTHSSLSNASGRVDAIHDSFFAKNHSKDSIPEEEHTISSSRLGHHHHTTSAATENLPLTTVDSEMTKNISDTLLRSASLPIKRKKSVSQAKTPAPKTPLPPAPTPPQRSSATPTHEPIVPVPSYTDSFHDPLSQTKVNPISGVQPEKLNLYPSNTPPLQQYNHTVPQYFHHSPHKYHMGSNSNHYMKRGITHPSQQHFIPSSQPIMSHPYRNPNPNPAYGPYLPMNRTPNHPKISSFQQTQQLLYPQQSLQFYQHMPNNANNKRGARFSAYSPQTSPQMANFNFNNNDNYLEPYLPYNAPATPPSHMKRNNKFQDVDLSHIIPR